MGPRGWNERRFNVLPALKRGGLPREIALRFFTGLRAGSAAGICLLRRETFGQELSDGQLSVSWLSATACQRSLFLPNSCKSEQGRRAASETSTRCFNSLAGAAFANICKTREETRRDGV